MEQQREIETTYTLNPFPEMPLSHITTGADLSRRDQIADYEQVERESKIVVIYAFNPHLETLQPLDYGTIVGPGYLFFDVEFIGYEKTRVQAIEIDDPIFEETYTAYVTKRSSKWCGWIPDVPEVECEEKTKTELLKTLADKLHEALEEEEEEWKKQFGAAVKAGKFDPLREEALEDVRAGRFTYL